MRAACLLVLLVSVSPVAARAADAPAVGARAASLHERILVLDSHLDTPANFARAGWEIQADHSTWGAFSQVDLPRIRDGGLDGGFWVIYTGQGDRSPRDNLRAQEHGLVRLTEIRETVAAHPQDLAIAYRADDAVHIAAAGKRVVYIAMENASPLAADPGLLKVYHRLGLRMLGITHVRNNEFGDSSNTAPEWNGLSPAGKALVADANRLGIVLDASHASDAVFDQLLELSRAPIVLSHSGAKALYDHPRNIDDARIRRLAARAGVLQVNAYGGYLVPVAESTERRRELDALEARLGGYDTLDEAGVLAWLAAEAQIDARHPVRKATFDDYMRHLLHILEVAGVDHVGIGADWDGGGGVDGLEDVTHLPRITQALLDAGYSEQDVEKIWGGNLLRVMREVERVAAAAQGTSPR